ncbi:hypothetical protein ERICV_01887 [Paenibacillus larvae subsp. larvae]|uniref:Uncharacterized protein n=2 Tax=Paenibacillus larvae TaxID=1464 RepID=A0A6C0QR31_9BACL|nr:hypothetical protein ERICV_01887 [Paenibacillus larvae subsp. larvae]
MRRIQMIDEVQQLHLIFNKVFKTNNPFSEVFTNSINKKIILCPTYGYYLDEQQYEALKNAAKHIGEDIFYLSEIEGNSFKKEENDEIQYDFGHWEVTCETEYENYLKAPIVLENAMYSQSARWGIIISHESHAIVGGNEEFIGKFKETYPAWKNSLNNFIEQWEYNQKYYKSNLEWLPSFLSYFKE